MLRDVGSNMGGEFAGFTPEHAATLVKARAAAIVCEFDPATHRFDPKTEQVIEIEAVELEAAPGEDVDALKASLDEAAALQSVSDQAIAQLKSDLAAGAELVARADLEISKLKGDLAAATELLGEPATTPEAPPQS